jgi:hypothetical protein
MRPSPVWVDSVEEVREPSEAGLALGVANLL